MTSAQPKHTETNPSLVQIWSRAVGSDVCAFEVQGTIPAEQHQNYGAPDVVWLSVQLEVPSAASVSLQFDVQWFDKTPTRLAEASWVTFAPLATDFSTGWQLHGFRTGLANPASDFGVDPADIVAHGATHLHSLGPFATVDYHGRLNGSAATDGRQHTARISLASVDAPIVSAGLLSPFPTPSENTTIASRLANGMHWNVHNNIWNTNFPQWYPFVDADRGARFRFAMDVKIKINATVA